MKQNYFKLLILFFMISCGGGAEEPEDPGKPTPPPGIIISVPEVTLPEASTGSTTAKFTTSDPWSLETSDTKAAVEWFDVTPKSGGAGDVTLTIVVTQENTGYDDRSGYIRIKVGSITKIITVTQKKKDALLLTKDRYDMLPSGGEFSVEVKSNITYNVTIDDACRSWITKGEKTKGLTTKLETFTVSEGSTEGNREGTIIFSSGVLADTVHVYQQMRNTIVLTTRTKTIDSKAQSFTVELRTNVDYTMKIPVGSWVKLNTTKSSRVDRVDFMVEENHDYDARTEKVVFIDKNSSLTDTLTITQASKNGLILVTEEASVESVGGTINVDIQSNVQYEVMIPKEVTWIQSVQTKSLGTYNHKFTVSKNADYGSRSAVITFKSGALIQNFTVNQGGSPATIALDKTTHLVTSQGDSFKVKVFTNGAPWGISGAPSWITLSAAQGEKSDSLVVTCGENPTASSRHATLLFSAGEATQTLTVTQNGANATISLDKSIQDVGSGSGSLLVRVTTNGVPWTVSNMASWVTLSKEQGIARDSVTLLYERNPNVGERTDTLTFTAGGSKAKFVIRQAGTNASITLDKTSQTVVDGVNSFLLQVMTNGASWSTIDVPGWITLSPASGTLSSSVTVSCEANPGVSQREAVISFISGLSVQKLTVTQKGGGATLSLDKLSHDAPSGSGSFRLQVTTNGAPWTTTNVPSWVTLSPARGDGSGAVSVAYEPNNTASSRVATITFTSGLSTQILTITQGGANASISLDKTSLEVENTSGSFPLQVTTNGAAWNTSGVPSWVTLTPGQGSGSGSLTVQYEANRSVQSRTATLTFISGSSTQTFTLTQKGGSATISLDKSSHNAPSGSGSFQLQVTTNGAPWNTTGVPSWVTLSPSQGDGSRAVSVAYEPNTTASSRVATITFTSGLSTQVLTITQGGANASITLDKTSQTVVDGVNSFLLQVTTNGASWSTMNVPQWVTLSAETGTGSGPITVTCSANPNYHSRTATISFMAGLAKSFLTITQNGAEATLTIDKASQEVGAGGGSFSLRVTTNGATWTTQNPSLYWMTFSPQSGSGGSTDVQFSCKENTSSLPRSMTISFISRGITKIFKVTQAGTIPTISLDKSVHDITSSRFDIVVTTNGSPWTATGIPDWLNFQPPSGTMITTYVAISVAKANPSVNPRSAVVTFTSGSASTTLTVNQPGSAPTISIDKSQETVVNTGGTFEVNVDTNDADWNITDIPEWLTFTPTSGSGDRKVVVTCKANPTERIREGNPRFNAGSKNASLRVLQEAGTIPFSLSASGNNVNNGSGSTTVTVNGSFPWTTSNVPSWVTLSPTSGSKGGSVRISYEANAGYEPRSGIINFTSGNVTKTYNLMQAASNLLKVTKADYMVKYNGGVVNVELQSNVSFTTAIDVAWITAIETRSVTTSEKSYNVAENKSGTKRTGHITYSGGGKTQVVTVEQSNSGSVTIGIGDWENDGTDNGGTAQ